MQQVPFRAPRLLHQRLKDEAKRQGVSMNSMLVMIVSEHLTLGTTERKVDELFRKVGAMAEQCLENPVTRQLFQVEIERRGFRELGDGERSLVKRHGLDLADADEEGPSDWTN